MVFSVGPRTRAKALGRRSTSIRFLSVARRAPNHIFPSIKMLKSRFPTFPASSVPCQAVEGGATAVRPVMGSAEVKKPKQPKTYWSSFLR